MTKKSENLSQEELFELESDELENGIGDVSKEDKPVDIEDVDEEESMGFLAADEDISEL